MLPKPFSYKIDSYWKSSGSSGLPLITDLQLRCPIVIEEMMEATESTTRPKIISGCGDN